MDAARVATHRPQVLLVCSGDKPTQPCPFGRPLPLEFPPSDGRSFHHHHDDRVATAHCQYTTTRPTSSSRPIRPLIVCSVNQRRTASGFVGPGPT